LDKNVEKKYPVCRRNEILEIPEKYKNIYCFGLNMPYNYIARAGERRLHAVCFQGLSLKT
jgi:hypothetical protein